MLEKELTGDFHTSLVILSVIIGILVSYTAINLVIKNTSNKKKNKLWLITSSCIMGGGVWTVHFIGMLAFHLGIKVSYNIGLVILAFFSVVISSNVSFWIMGTYSKKKYLILCSIIMGSGISVMHYLGMEAMEIDAEIKYDPILFIASIILGIIISGISFWSFFELKNKGYKKVPFKISASIFLGLAISSMHYTGMSATTFLGHSSDHFYVDNYAISDFILAIIISSFIFLVLLIILVTSIMEERYTSKLEDSEAQYRQLVELSPVGIVIHQFGILTYLNPAAIRILGGNSMEELISRNILDFIHHDYHETVKKRWSLVREDHTHVPTIEEKFIRLDKQVIDVEIMAMPIISNGKPINKEFKENDKLAVQVVFWDITEKKKEKDILRYRAYHDTLTDLYNRNKFESDIAEKIKKNKPFLLMYLTLEGLERINNSYGHQTGDVVLIKVGALLAGIIGQKGLVYRMDGVEFSVVLPGQIEDAEVKEIAESIAELVTKPIYINNSIVKVSPRIGIVSYPEHGVEVNMLLHHAIMAMNHAKKTNTLYKKYDN